MQITLEFGAPRAIDLLYAPPVPPVFRSTCTWVYVDPPAVIAEPLVMSQCNRTDAQCAADCRAPECYR